MNEKERIDLLLKHLKLTKNALGKAMGNTNGQIITNIQKGINSISPNFASRITNIYQHINYDWLLTGEGEIESKEYVNREEIETNTKEEGEKYSVRGVVKDSELLVAALKDKDKIIELLELQLQNLRRELRELKEDN